MKSKPRYCIDSYNHPGKMFHSKKEALAYAKKYDINNTATYTRVWDGPNNSVNYVTGFWSKKEIEVLRA